MVEKMSIHRALAEIKTYNKRIASAVEQTFIVANKKSNEKIEGMTIEEYKSKIQSNLDSAKALIENRKRIKTAIIMSNAKTIVNIAGKDYTIAEAIERKNMIATERYFINNMKNQYTRENRVVESENNELPSKLEAYLKAILGEKDKRTVDDIELHTKSFYSRNEYELIDPMNIKDFIDTYEKSIDEFETNVDYILSESNATTFIEVDLCN